MMYMRTPIDIRPVTVAFVTALWQGERDAADEMLIDLYDEAIQKDIPFFGVTLDVVDVLSDMVLTLIETHAHEMGENCQEWTAEILAEFGRDAVS